MVDAYFPATRVFYADRLICIHSPELILGEVEWGQRIHIGAGTSIQAEGGLSIGDDVVISYNCIIWTINHDYTDSCLPYGKSRLKAPVIINRGVWVGRNAMIVGRVTIGEGAIIGMGAVVSRDVPPLAIVVGNPARIVGFRPIDAYIVALRNHNSLWQQKSQCGACTSSDFYLEKNPVAKMRKVWPWPFRSLSIWLYTRSFLKILNDK